MQMNTAPFATAPSPLMAQAVPKKGSADYKSIIQNAINNNKVKATPLIAVPQQQIVAQPVVAAPLQ